MVRGKSQWEGTTESRMGRDHSFADFPPRDGKLKHFDKNHLRGEVEKVRIV